MTIRKRGVMYELVSKTGKVLFRSRRKSEVEAREKQVQFFKNKKKP